MFGDRASSQASATCAGVASSRRAARLHRRRVEDLVDVPAERGAHREEGDERDPVLLAGVQYVGGDAVDHVERVLHAIDAVSSVARCSWASETLLIPTPPMSPSARSWTIAPTWSSNCWSGSAAPSTRRLTTSPGPPRGSASCPRPRAELGRAAGRQPAARSSRRAPTLLTMTSPSGYGCSAAWISSFATSARSTARCRCDRHRARRPGATPRSRRRGPAAVRNARAGKLHRAEADAGDGPARARRGGINHAADGIRSKRNGRSDYTEGTGRPSAWRDRPLRTRTDDVHD